MQVVKLLELGGDTSLSNLNNSTYSAFNNQPQGRGRFTLHPPYTSLFLEQGQKIQSLLYSNVKMSVLTLMLQFY
jgi:hypothetical protein